MVYCRTYWLHIAKSLSQLCYEDDAPLGTAPRFVGGGRCFFVPNMCVGSMLGIPNRPSSVHLGVPILYQGQGFLLGFSEVNIFGCKNKLGQKQPLLVDDSLKDFEAMVLFCCFSYCVDCFKMVLFDPYLIWFLQASTPKSEPYHFVVCWWYYPIWPYGGGMVVLPGRVRCFVNNEHSTGLRMVPEMLRKGLRLEDFQRCLLLFLSERKGDIDLHVVMRCPR